MDAEQELSNSPGSSPSSTTASSSPRSRDSDIEFSIENFVEDEKAASSSDEEEEDEIGEFLSGGEEFEEEPPVPVEDDSEAAFVDFPEPIAVPEVRASAIDSDDDDDDIVGGVEEEEEGEGEGVLSESKVFGDGSGSGSIEGLKILGVSGSGEDGEIGDMGVVGTPKPVMVVKGLGENGGLGDFVKGIGVGDTSEGIDGTSIGVEEDKVLEIPKLGMVGSSVVTEESNVPEKMEVEAGVVADEQLAGGLEVNEKGREVEEGASLGSGIGKVEPVIVEPVSDVMEVDSVVDLASRAAVVGDVEEDKHSEIKEPEKVVELSVGGNTKTTEVELDGSDAPETDEAAVGEGNADEPLAGEALKPTLVKPNGEDDGDFVKLSNDRDMGAVIDVEKMEPGAEEDKSTGVVAEEKPVMEVDPITDLGMDTTDSVDGAEPSKDDGEVHVSSQDELLDEIVRSFYSSEKASLSNSVDRPEAEEDEEIENSEEEGELEDQVTDEEDESGDPVTDEEDMIFESNEAAKQFIEGLKRRSGKESSYDHLQRIDGQIVTDSDEEAETDEEGDGKELFDSAALAALLKAATGADTEDGNITITSKDGSKLFSVERPAGLGSSLRPKPPTSWSNRPNLFNPSTISTGGETEKILSDDEKEKLEKLQQIRVKFLRLVQRLGHSPDDQIAAQVLYRLALVAGRQTNQLFNLDDAKRTASQLEEESQDDLNFSLNILVIGKTGVGKSSTINSIFGEEKSHIDAFQYGTNSVKEINGTVGGVKIRVFDTPGLKSSVFEQGYNRRVLSSVKRFTKKCPPDIVLYVDRMDTQTRDLNDLPLLKTITSTLGSSIWRSAIVTLTHAASAPPDGPTGNPLSYEVFVAQRSHIVLQSISQSVGDLRMMNPSTMNPVSLVENHPSCRKNRDGLKVLPNGTSWKPQLLFLCYSMKILSEASSVSKPQDPFDHQKLFGFRSRAPPLPYLLSWLLQSRTHPKLLTDQSRDDVDSDVFDGEVDEEEDEEEEDEYDELPPFRPLTKEQLNKLSKEQRNAYFDEYEYRVKLLQKQQWKEMKKGKVGTDDVEGEGEGEADNASDGMVPVPLPDMVLPHSFDGDNTSYRYRFLDPQSHLLTRPVLDAHGWDHDCGYDGVNIENRALVIKNQYPASVAVQITKDKKDFNIHLDSSVSAKHGEKGSSMVGFDIQNVGKQLAYIVRAESKFKNLKRNKTTAGASVTFLGENIATGVKVEDQLALGKRFLLIGSTGTVRCKSDAAYGANLEVQLREADYPIGQDQSSLGLSLVKWRGDLALGANLQSQVTVGRGSKVTLRAGLNNKRSGQISIALNSTEQLQLALIGIIPLARAIYKALSPGVGAGDNYGMY